MSSDSELPRTHRAWPTRQSKAQGRAALADGPFALLDSRVLTFPEWCAVNGFSLRTGRRLIQRGDGPIVTQLSPQRIGVTIGADKAWKAARARRARHD
jgi:hypothetical protein